METQDRCPWAGPEELYRDYHDNEWGRPTHDDRRLFELLTQPVCWGAIALTLGRILAGFLLGVLLGVLLGALTAASKLAADGHNQFVIHMETSSDFTPPAHDLQHLLIHIL